VYAFHFSHKPFHLPYVLRNIRLAVDKACCRSRILADAEGWLGGFLGLDPQIVKRSKSAQAGQKPNSILILNPK
jgi:hypothetical protein